MSPSERSARTGSMSYIEEEIAEEAAEGTAIAEETKRTPLSFSPYGFKPRAWERKRIHRYSVRSPQWWSLWLRMREFGAKLGIS